MHYVNMDFIKQEQIKHRQELLNYYRNLSDKYKLLSEIVLEQLTSLNDKQESLQSISDIIRSCGLLPVESPDEVFNRLRDKYSTELGKSKTSKNTFYNYMTAEDVKNYAEKVETERKTIIMDISLIPAEYKGKTIVETVKFYKEEFNVKIIPIDTSRQNTQGSSNHPPIFTVL